MSDQPIRTWTLNPENGHFFPLPQDRTAPRFEVMSKEPMLDLLEELKAEMGRDWMYVSTPLAQSIERLLREHGRLS